MAKRTVVTIWYSPEADQFYLHDGFYGSTVVYTEVGGYEDEDGDKFYVASIFTKNPKVYGWIKLGDL